MRESVFWGVFLVGCLWGAVVFATGPVLPNSSAPSREAEGTRKEAHILKAYREYLDSKKNNIAGPVSSPDARPQGGDNPTGYLIGVGDVLEISVWKDDALTRQVTVLPDGTISFPLIGPIQARNLTLDELRASLSEHLEKFIPHPVISMAVVRVNSLMIYVIGKVNRPGRFDLIGNIDVLQALSLAGGLNAFAKTRQVKVFRKTKDGTKILPFDYDAVCEGEELAQNITLERGDVIVVP